LPPPKELDTDSEGRLVLKSYYRWELMVMQTINQEAFGNIKSLLGNSTAYSIFDAEKWTCGPGAATNCFVLKNLLQALYGKAC